jgi:hypothetical protein
MLSRRSSRFGGAQRRLTLIQAAVSDAATVVSNFEHQSKKDWDWPACGHGPKASAQSWTFDPGQVVVPASLSAYRLGSFLETIDNDRQGSSTIDKKERLRWAARFDDLGILRRRLPIISLLPIVAERVPLREKMHRVGIEPTTQ